MSRLVAWALALALPAAAPAAPRTAAFAIVMGVNQSPDLAVANLRYADDDAARYFELFSAYAEKTVLLSVLDAESQRRFPEAVKAARPPTREQLARAVAEVARQAAEAAARGRAPEIYFVYAGHGGLGAGHEGYVGLLDGKLTRGELFREVLAPLGPYPKHLLVDACGAYYLVAKRGEAAADELRALKAFLAEDDLSLHPEIGVVVATSSEQATHEWSALESGVFSHELRSALLGAADADGDGVLRYAEIAAFLAAANEGLSDPRARIEVFVRPPAMELARPLLSLARGRWTRYLEISAPGRYEVRDERGLRYADLHSSGERPAVLALLGDGTYYLRQNDQEARIQFPAPGVLAAQAVRWQALAAAPRSALGEELQRNLFAIPFGPGFARGYAARDPALGPLLADAAPFPPPAIPRVFKVEEPATPWTLRSYGYLSVATALAFGAGAGVAGTLTQQSYDGFVRKLAAQGVADKQLAQRVDTGRTTTNVLLGLGLASGAAAALLLYFDAPRVPSASMAGGALAWEF